MAKKKQESGPGVFMILALVFFVLTSVVLGVTTYLGFKDADQYEKMAKAAEEEKNKAAKNAAEQTLRRNMLRIAIGSEEPTDRTDLTGGAKEHKDALLDEYNRTVSKLGAAGALPGKNDFQWRLDGDEPAPAPTMTIPEIAKRWATMFKNMEAQKIAADDARRKAEAAAAAEKDATDKAKETFDQKVADLNKQVSDKLAAMDAAFKALETNAKKAGADFAKQANEWAAARAQLEEAINLKNLEIERKNQEITRLKFPDPSDIESRFRHWNVAKTAERIGIVQDKSETFVTVQFGTRMNLVPGQTFVVIASNGSLVEVLDREKALEKHHHTVVSLGPREPFADNELVKGMVEITDVINDYSARARITYQANEIRNPIGKGDQLFNVALSHGGKEHVAFAGIIDLDGDGRPNNEEFVRILEKNNMTIDAYLDLKTGEIKGSGIGFKTKFLVVGADAPLVGNVKKMIEQANKMGVQLIEARMFLTLIGVKPPRNAAPPAYTTVTLGGEGEKNMDPAAPMPPMVPRN